MAQYRQDAHFDLELAIDCAFSYFGTTGLGCVVCDAAGVVLHESGLGCESCRICSMDGPKNEACTFAALHSVSATENSEGGYTYLCPMGLNCFVSLITEKNEIIAAIIAGPFLMANTRDYLIGKFRNTHSTTNEMSKYVSQLLKHIPFVPEKKSQHLFKVLTMQVGFIRSRSATVSMAHSIVPDASQYQATDYSKDGIRPQEYPIKTEKKLLTCIAECDKTKAQMLLNKLFGHIFFSSGGNLDLIKSKTYELLVIISRAAMDVGISTDQAMRMNYLFWQRAMITENIDDLCVFLAEIINRYIDSVFNLSRRKETEIICKAVSFMSRNCTKKITLEETAKNIYLSPTYFSKVFQKEMGCNFSSYLNKLRIDKSKQLLLTKGIRLSDIAAMVGFEDQSYFTKVFSRIMGTTPSNYRKTNSK